MSKILTVVLIALLLLFGITKARGRQKVNPGAAPYRKIGPAEVKTLMADPAAVILDVRTPGEFYSGHIKGAINIPNESIEQSRPTLLDDLDAPILVYCRSGARSARAAVKLLNLGYTAVYDFGGIIAWPDELVR